MGIEFFGFFAAFLMGITLGTLGGGGSILTVPILVYLFKINPIEATAYSLFIVGLTAFAGGISYYRKGDVEFKIALLFSLPGFIGVYLVRSFIIPNLPDPILSLPFLTITKPILIMTVFSALMILASKAMILGRKDNGQKVEQEKSIIKTLKILIQGFGVGCLSGFVGAGGGFIIIPALVFIVGLPMRKAIGTSLFIIAINSLLGFTGDLKHHDHFDWKFLITIATIAILGLIIGVHFSNRVPEKTLKKSFGIFILLMGAFIFIDQLRRI